MNGTRPLTSKLKSKRIKDSNVGPEAIKLLEDDIDRNASELLE